MDNFSAFVNLLPAASPATGLNKIHLSQQDELCRKALTGEPAEPVRENF